MNLYQHRGVDIVVSQVEHRWLITWKFPNEEDSIHVYHPTKSQALGYAKKQIDQFFDGYQDFPVMWRKGEDWWSGIEIENGVVPSDAIPVYRHYEE